MTGTKQGLVRVEEELGLKIANGDARGERQEFLVANRGALDLAFSLTDNTFNGETRTELTLADMRATEATAARSGP